MGKHLLVALLCFIPCVAFCQVKNAAELTELYRQVDSLQFSILRTKDSLQQTRLRSRMEQSQANDKFELYSTLVRLENNRLRADDSMFLNVKVSSKYSGGVSQVVTSIEVNDEAVQSLIGLTDSVERLFDDFPRLQQQYRLELLVETFL